MASLLEHVAINKLIDDLGDAITSVGGDVTGADKPCDYVEIIKNQLIAKGLITGPEITAGIGTTVEKTDKGYTISANANANLVKDLPKPFDTDMQPGIEDIKEGTSIQDTLKVILSEIIPTLPSVIKGDIITSTVDGTDTYSNLAFANSEEGTKTGLESHAKYLRLFLATRLEPIYILLNNIVPEYNLTAVVTNGEYVSLEATTQKTNELLSLDIKVNDTAIKNALDNKAQAKHNHVAEDITDFDDAVDKKLAESKIKVITFDEIDAMFVEESSDVSVPK